MDTTRIVIIAIFASVVAAFLVCRGRAKVGPKGPLGTGLEIGASKQFDQTTMKVAWQIKDQVYHAHIG